MVEKPFIREHARARAGTTGNRSAKSNENSVLTATDELRTYKINLLGKSKWRIVIPGNGFDRAPRQLIERAPGQPVTHSKHDTMRAKQIASFSYEAR